MSAPQTESPAAITFSIIIPTVNEAQALPALLRAINRQHDVSVEVIVADGGSDDATPAIAAAAGARLLACALGRSRQLNAGARAASGDLLLFLHADSMLCSSRHLADSGAALQRHIHRCGHRRVAGHFALSFRREAPGHELHYRYMAVKTGLNRRHTVNGDQGLLLHRDFFRALGGFDESLHFLEDQRIAAQIRDRGKWITLPGRLQTSARRFETEGLHRRYILMAIIMGLYEIGMTEFFQRARALYDVQSETGRLALTPFLDLIAALMAKRSRRERRRLWRHIGRYTRENTWQLFLLADVFKAHRHRRPEVDSTWLSRYDRWFPHRLARPAVDRVLAALVRFWVMGVLRAYFRVSEHRLVAKCRAR